MRIITVSAFFQNHEVIILDQLESDSGELMANIQALESRPFVSVEDSGAADSGAADSGAADSGALWSCFAMVPYSALRFFQVPQTGGLK